MNILSNHLNKTLILAFAALFVLVFAIAPVVHAADLGDGGYYDFSYPSDMGGGSYYDYSYPTDYSNSGSYYDYSYPSSYDSYSYPSYSSYGGYGGYASYPSYSGYGGYSTYSSPSNSNTTVTTNTNTCTATNSCNSIVDDHSVYNYNSNTNTNSGGGSYSYPVYIPTPTYSYTQPVYYPTTYTYTTTPVPQCNTCACSTVYCNPAPYVSLAAVPYTGLDLGPVGTVLYWSFLVLWCLAAAYLIVVKRVQNRLVRSLNAFLFGETMRHSAAHSSSAKSSPLTPSDSQTRGQSLDSKISPAIGGIDPFIASQINRA